MNIGIVGSRRRKCKERVESLIVSLQREWGDDLVIISGGCKGVDTWAENYAKRLGIMTEIFLPDLEGITNKGDMISRYYERNRKIVENSSFIFAFVSEDRRGGTENTVAWTKQLDVPCVIMDGGA